MMIPCSSRTCGVPAIKLGALEENEKGPTEKGKLADLLVISKDITKSAAKEILSLYVLKTLVTGKPVFDAGTGTDGQKQPQERVWGQAPTNGSGVI